MNGRRSSSRFHSHEPTAGRLKFAESAWKALCDFALTVNRNFSHAKIKKPNPTFNRIGPPLSNYSMTDWMRLTRTRSGEKHRTNPNRKIRDGEPYLQI